MRAAPADTVLELAEAEHIARNRLAFFGHAAHFPELVDVRWHLGLADAVTIRLARACDLTDLVQQLLDHPTFSALRHLDLQDPDGWLLEDALQGLVLAGPSLPSLAIRASNEPDSAAVSKALAAVRGLRTLILQTDRLGELGLPELPAGLEVLEVCGHLEPEALAEQLPRSVRRVALLSGEAQALRRLRPDLRVEVARPEPLDPVEVDAPWNYMEESDSSDALDVHWRPVWESWHHKEPIVSYEDDPEPQETPTMPVIADWNLRGEPEGPPEPDDEWWYV